MSFVTQEQLENDTNIRYVKVTGATQRVVINSEGEKPIVVEFSIDIESFLEDYLREHGYAPGGTMGNPDEMDFATGSNFEIIKGTLDEVNQRVFC